MSAKEMFEKLGYKKVEGLRIGEETFITYKNDNNNIYIWFSGINDKNSFGKWKLGLFGTKYQDITDEELQAINKQREELGWNSGSTFN